MPKHATLDVILNMSYRYGPWNDGTAGLDQVRPGPCPIFGTLMLTQFPNT